MSNRNFILLIIVLIITTLGVLYYFLSYKPQNPTNGGEGTNFLSEFNPFGGTTTQKKPTEEPTYSTPEVVEVTGTKFKKVSTMPIAGYGTFKKERYTKTGAVPETETDKPTPPAAEFMTALRYVTRADGNIYQTFADDIDERKFSNTTIPKVYEAYFGNKGETVVIRNLQSDEMTIDTFIGNLPKEVLGADSTANEIRGAFLTENIKDLSISYDQSKVFYLAPTTTGVTGISLGFIDNKKSAVMDSPFSEWLPLWPNSKMITLTTKPSALIPGYMYSIDPAVKKLNKILGDINGLTTLTSPNGKLVAYSGNNLALQLYDIGTKTSMSLGVITLPEKCVWDSGSVILYCAAPKTIPGALYPDAWYKGEISFSDQIWKIDTVTGTTEIILDPVITVGEDIDGIKLQLDADEEYLFFVNKKDSHLWEFILN